MTDDDNNPLVEELADARERIAELEQHAERQAAAARVSSNPEEALRQLQGEAALAAVQRARKENR